MFHFNIAFLDAFMNIMVSDVDMLCPRVSLVIRSHRDQGHIVAI